MDMSINHNNSLHNILLFIVLQTFVCLFVCLYNYALQP